VDLIEVGNGQADLFLYDFAVAEHGFQIVADVRTDIQATVHTFADTAVARGNKRFNIGRGRPVGSQKILALRGEV